jgi:hypothetical protein
MVSAAIVPQGSKKRVETKIRMVKKAGFFIETSFS